jgi:hypothetical protein
LILPNQSSRTKLMDFLPDDTPYGLLFAGLDIGHGTYGVMESGWMLRAVLESSQDGG